MGIGKRVVKRKVKKSTKDAVDELSGNDDDKKLREDNDRKKKKRRFR
jgi:hypothetical protein